MNALEVKDARKRYGATEALRGVSLAVSPGEWVALLGPNGAGKTTLVRAIAGRVRLDAGTLALLGRPLATASSRGARAGLGVVPQEIALYPLLSARENLEVFGRLNGVAGSALRERVRWALAWTGLAERAHEPVRRFSGGMKRRLNIACGVLHRPRVVLLDEPTVGVDPQSRARILEMLEALRAEGAALLLTTHQLEDAEARCDRIVIVDHGAVIADGTLAALVAGTIGARRRVTVTLDRVPATPLPGFANGDGPVFHGELDDVATELGALLARVHGAGCAVRDLDVRAPSLQAVFLHLTGRELRE
ncbi:MAG TPA: ABC transporter ATP-binding protein [Candidatus Eisenbacteria bacterium]|nr:ABC transporter ATP-binding protein [Candidatus Eisenbacteria bacterium]